MLNSSQLIATLFAARRLASRLHLLSLLENTTRLLNGASLLKPRCVFSSLLSEVDSGGKNSSLRQQVASALFIFATSIHFASLFLPGFYLCAQEWPKLWAGFGRLDWPKLLAGLKLGPASGRRLDLTHLPELIAHFD